MIKIGYRKEAAIKKAEERAKETDSKTFVIASPDTYNDIFNGTQYQVVDSVDDDERASIVFETD